VLNYYIRFKKYLIAINHYHGVIKENFLYIPSNTILIVVIIRKDVVKAYSFDFPGFQRG